jgi:hypothetical protein
MALSPSPTAPNATQTAASSPQPTPGNVAGLQAPSTLILGEVGAGKTHCLVTLAQAGIEVFVIVTEPTGLDTLIDSFAEAGVIDKLHYHALSPARKGFADMEKQAKILSISGQDTLAKQAPQGDRTKATWLQLLRTLMDFPCQRTGEMFGPVDSWDDSRALVIDSLSGLNIMAMDITIGDKLTAGPGEWQIAMNSLERLILKLTNDCKCYTVLTAHVEKETDPISGAQKVMAGALGSKLAPKLPRFFSEVVHAYRSGSDFYWSTMTANFNLKKRSLPLADKLKPSFAPIVEAYGKRKAAAKGA